MVKKTKTPATKKPAKPAAKKNAAAKKPAKTAARKAAKTPVKKTTKTAAKKTAAKKTTGKAGSRSTGKTTVKKNTKATAKAAPKKTAPAKAKAKAPVKKPAKPSPQAAPKPAKTVKPAPKKTVAAAPVPATKPKAAAKDAPKKAAAAPAKAKTKSDAKAREKDPPKASPADAFPALDGDVKRPAKPFFLEVKPGVERVIKRGDKSAVSQVIDLQARRKGPVTEETSDELAERIERELQNNTFLRRAPLRPQLCTKCGINAVSRRFTIDRELGYCDICAEILHLGETKEARRTEFSVTPKKDDEQSPASGGSPGGSGEDESVPEDVED